ncbi:hypothetical protein I4U23_002938 [Adineta vaga]|nr:hypothetical protein I4U23_002938 [Adineta vaga]
MASSESISIKTIQQMGRTTKETCERARINIQRIQIDFFINDLHRTTKTREVSIDFAERAETNPVLVATPFASICDLNAIPSEDEV